jgi:hypothetical protein
MTHSKGAKHLCTGDSLAAINARHKTLLESAAASLRAAAELVQTSAPPELAATLPTKSQLTNIGEEL